MKRFLVSTLALGLMSGLALAQDTSSTQAPAASQGHAKAGHRHSGMHGQGMKGHKMDPASHADMLAKKLDLSADQKTKVQSILEDMHKQMEAMHDNTSMSKADRHAKMKELHESTMTQVRAVLNADQQKKFDEMQEKMKARREKHEANEAKEKDEAKAPAATPKK